MAKINLPNKFHNLTDFFKRLHRYLSNDTPFYDGYNDNYCKYVNFYINKNINSSYSEEENKQYFSLINKFGTELKIFRERNFSCNPYLHYIDPEIFPIMKALYDLYDRYNSLIQSKESKGSQAGIPCRGHGIFRYLYNDMIDKYDGKENYLIERLREIKDLVGKNIFSPNKVMCDEQVTFYREPQKYLKEKEQLELAQKMQEQQQQQLQQQQQQEQIEESSGNKNTQQEEETESRKQLLSLKPEEEQRISLGTEQSHVDLNILDPELPKYSGIPKVETSPYKQEMEENEVEKHGTVYPSVKNDELGYFGKMQGVITGVLGEVEPGPILGVSGGMGALFLLFKVYKVLKIYSYVYNTFKYNLPLP
ncbi:hypothetical protein PVNG_01548 [Plasmodium vivax North Korean]|uniref:VIR protein n=1 Tax=Plasmodium vivax North Korean TaxID=1035514 RepID=A0A0J9WFH0_PLAVI|nr:hypothetical protein PVNG_01548 [Plasmodium vivax North Korean]